MQATQSRSALDSFLGNGDLALWSGGDLTASRAWFDAAYQLAEQQADGPAVARAALGLAGLWPQELRISAATAVLGDRLRRAAAAVPTHSPLALRLRTRLAAESDYRIGGHAEITAALAQARAAADPVAVADALRLAHHCLLGPEHGPRRAELAEALIAESARTARRGDLVVGQLLRAVDLLLDADPNAARRLTELRRLLDVDDHRVVRFVLQAIDVMAEIRAGRLDEAEAMAKQCTKSGEAAGDLSAVNWYGAHMMAIRWFQGRTGELLPMVRVLADSPLLSQTDYSFRAALAMAAAAAGQRREALGAIAAFVDGVSDIPSSGSWLVSLYTLTEASLLLERADVAAEAYRLLIPYRRLPMMAEFGVACFGSVEHALGVARLAMGDFDGAVPHLRSAVRQNEALGNRPAAVLARHRLAHALARSTEPEQRAMAAYQAEAARRDAERFGMDLPGFAPSAPLLPSAMSTGADGPRPEPSPANVAELTCHRRGKVWEIVANGHSVVVEHCRGMAYLAVLLANPRREISALELVGGPGLRQTSSTAAMDEAIGKSSFSQAILDQQAIGQYRTRLGELRRILEHCDASGDRERADAARAERDWLLTELRSATGLAGRSRAFSTEEERARISVGKAIRRALDRITALDRHVGACLAAGIRTGRACTYVPPTCLTPC